MADVTLSIVNGKCNLSSAQINGLAREADQIHAEALTIVDKGIQSLPNDAGQDQQTKLATKMQALVMVGAVSDAIKISRSLCTRLGNGLKAPGDVQATLISSAMLKQMKKAIEE